MASIIWITQPASTTIYVGQNITFNVFAEVEGGGSEDYSISAYNWYEGTPTTTPSSPSLGTGASYTIDNVTTGDAGEYFCVATATSGEIITPPPPIYGASDGAILTVSQFPIANNLFQSVTSDTPNTADPDFQAVFCAAQSNYYFALRFLSPDQAGCTISTTQSPFTYMDIHSLDSENNYVWTVNTTSLILNNQSTFMMVPQMGMTNQFDLYSMEGIQIDTYYYKTSPDRLILGSFDNTSENSGTVTYFFIPDGRNDRSGNPMNNYLTGDQEFVDWSSFQLGCVVANSPGNSNNMQYGNLVAAYCNDSLLEMCLQGGSPGSSRVVLFTGSPIDGGQFDVPFSMLNYTDGCTAFYCNDQGSQTLESYGGYSMNPTCTTYLNMLLELNNATGRYTPALFLTPNGDSTTNNQCLISTSNNLFTLMSSQCVLYCQETATDNTSPCVIARNTFCSQVMPVSGSVDENYTNLCACYYNTTYYNALTQQTVNAISELYPGLNSVLTTLFTDNQEPWCSYAPCTTGQYTLTYMKQSSCRAVDLCLQSINASIGTATNSNLNIANSCVINNISGSGTSLTPDQQAAVNAYNDGTLGQAPAPTSFFKRVIDSFDLTAWILFGIMVAVVVIVVIFLIIAIVRKRKVPNNAYEKNKQGVYVPVNYKPPPVVIVQQQALPVKK